MKNEEKKIIVILGQTATGKSALAVLLAKKINGEIISADSRQVYKKLDIGTGKITENEMQGVPHHLLDVVNPETVFSVAEYKKIATNKLEEIFSRGKIPIICGGTGFYIDALINGQIFPEVGPDPKLRKEFSKKTTEELYIMLSKLDKRRASNIDAKNKVRLIRAIEIVKKLGKVPIVKGSPEDYPGEVIKIGLYLPEEKLKTKIEKRVKGMFDAGLLEEISKLKKSGVSQKRLQEFGFEYDNPTYESVVLKTLQYAKRQMTWFKRDKKIIWLDASQPLLKKCLNLIKKDF